jgi:flagellar biosynthesis protein FliR
MPAFEHILPHFVPFLLVAFRLAGLFVFTPVLANRLLPRTFRVMLVVMLAAALYPMLPGGVQVPPDVGLVDLAPLVIRELLIGLIIGFIAAMPIHALDLSGHIISHQIGLGLARVYNPDLQSDTDTTGQLVMYLGLAAFVGVGGLEVLFLSLADTFRNVPVGGLGVDQLPLDLLVGLIASGFELAVRVAAPVLCIIFLLMIAMGFVSKTMPQINIMSVGFTIKILAGLGMLAASLGAMQHATGDEVQRVLRLAVGWASGLR